jgi:hypothetical protein
MSFDIDDLMRIDENGKGSTIRLTDIQDKPKLFSTFMLSLPCRDLPANARESDSEQPELVILLTKLI